MAKKDITKTKDINSPGSMSEKKVENERAKLALEKAKAIPRKIIFLKMGEGQFSRSIKPQKSNLEVSITMLTPQQAAQYLNIAVGSVHQYKKLKQLEAVKINGRLFFETEEIERFRISRLKESYAKAH